MSEYRIAPRQNGSIDINFFIFKYYKEKTSVLGEIDGAWFSKGKP